jgi:primosomal protein N'
VSRVKGLFLLDLLLKMPNHPAKIAIVKKKIEAGILHIKEEKGFGSVRIVIDVDPY